MYQSHLKPELCSLLKWLALQLFETPWYLKTNDLSQPVLIGPFQSQAIGLADVALFWGPSITTPQGNP